MGGSAPHPAHYHNVLFMQKLGWLKVAIRGQNTLRPKSDMTRGRRTGRYKLSKIGTCKAYPINLLRISLAKYNSAKAKNTGGISVIIKTGTYIRLRPICIRLADCRLHNYSSSFTCSYHIDTRRCSLQLEKRPPSSCMPVVWFMIIKAPSW